MKTFFAVSLLTILMPVLTFAGGDSRPGRCDGASLRAYLVCNQAIVTNINAQALAGYDQFAVTAATRFLKDGNSYVVTGCEGVGPLYGSIKSENIRNKARGLTPELDIVYPLEINGLISNGSMTGITDKSDILIDIKGGSQRLLIEKTIYSANGSETKERTALASLTCK